MVEGYLMETKGVFDKIRDFLDFFPEDCNYQIYIPGATNNLNTYLVGYFADENLTLSKNKFCFGMDFEHFTEEYKKSLDLKIERGKFVKKLNFDRNFFLKFLNSAKTFNYSKKQFNTDFENLKSFLKAD